MGRLKFENRSFSVSLGCLYKPVDDLSKLFVDFFVKNSGQIFCRRLFFILDCVEAGQKVQQVSGLDVRTCSCCSCRLRLLSLENFQAVGSRSDRNDQQQIGSTIKHLKQIDSFKICHSIIKYCIFFQLLIL